MHIFQCTLASTVDMLSEVLDMHINTMNFFFVLFTDESSVKKFVGAFFKIHKTITTESDVRIPLKE